MIDPGTRVPAAPHGGRDPSMCECGVRKDATEVNARRQARMGEFFEDLDGAAPDAAMRPLSEVVHLD
ncbi:MAG: hypothetical protein ACRDVE_21910 [Actinocrinis sp.]